MGVGGADTYSLVVSPLVALDDLFGTKLQGENLTQVPNIGFSCNSFNILLLNLGHICLLQDTSFKYKPNTENTQSFRRATNLLQFAPEVNETSQLVRVKVKSKISIHTM
jgi:hypothetical protein